MKRPRLQSERRSFKKRGENVVDLHGKAFLVTGGGTGIGAAAAALLRSLGAEVAILGIDRAPIEEVAARTGAIAITGDAASSVDVGRALGAITERAGGLDGLLTCAGGGGMGKLGDIDDDGWARALRITLDTAMVSARTCLTALAARKGAIAIVSSVGGLMAPGGAAGYATAKAALIGLTRSLAHDYGPDIRVNALCPGLTRTSVGDMVMGELGKAMGADLDGAYQYATRWFPLRRAAQPAEIARTAAFLLSDWSSYMTGAILVADGGASAIGAAI